MLQHTLARLRPLMPQAVRRANEALDIALAGVRGSRWPEVAWCASGLTNTGYPVEWSWSSRDPSLRWTADTSAPETPERERLERALATLHALGGAAELPDWLWPRPGRELRFGAWLGGRHDERRDRYKLYVDAGGAPVPASESIPRRTTWRMAGLDGDVVELYGRIEGLEVWEAERMLAGIDIRPLMNIAARLAGAPHDDRLLPGTAGITVALRKGAVAAAGVFVQAGPLLGGDAAIARKIHELCAQFHWDATIYDALLGSDAPPVPGRHGMLGFGTDAEGRPWLQIGLRP